MRDELDTELHDGDMLDEIALCTGLIIAASGSTTRLSQHTIDRLLQQERPAAEPGGPSTSRPAPHG